MCAFFSPWHFLVSSFSQFLTYPQKINPYSQNKNVVLKVRGGLPAALLTSGVLFVFFGSRGSGRRIFFFFFETVALHDRDSVNPVEQRYIYGEAALHQVSSASALAYLYGPSREW